MGCSPSEEELVQEGILQMDAQNWSGAITLFDRALEINPENALALNAKGAALFQEEKFEEAVPVFTASIQADSASYNRYLLQPWTGFVRLGGIRRCTTRF